MIAIYKRELRSYFTTMYGYVFIAFMLLISGLFTMFLNLEGGYPNFEYVLSNVIFLFLFLILVPILTMRMFSEEKRQRTDSLLYALPMKMSSIVLGKYFAVLTVFGVGMLLMMIIPVILSAYGTVHFLGTYSCMLAFFLLGAALIALGMFASTLTESQVISAVIAFAALMLVFFLADIAAVVPTSPLASAVCFAVVIAALALIIRALTGEWVYATVTFVLLEVGVAVLYFVRGEIFEGAFPGILTKLSVFVRFNSFVNGIFDIGGLVYFLSIACLFVFFSIQSLEKKRWS